MDSAIMDYAARIRSIKSYSRKSLIEITYQLGYSSQSQFSEIFKQHFGITPGKFRKINTTASQLK